MMEQQSMHVSTSDQSETVARPQLQYFPISFFAAVLGLAGTTIAFQRAERLLSLPFTMSGFILVGALAAFLAIATLYALKVVRHPEAVKREFAHPIKINFFPTISISLLLFSIAFMRLNGDISRALWIVGAALHLLFTVAVLSAWMHRSTFQIQHINPSWFIPVVGNMIVPIAGVEHASVEISWFFFSIGLIFWVALFAIFLYRVVFYNPLPERLMPTLFIMIAPPAVGFISYLRLMEHAVSGSDLDGFARMLYYFGLFILMMLLAQYRRFIGIPFYLSWWAYSFPMAAITIATVLMASKTGMPFFQWLAYVLLVALAALIAALLFRTIAAVVQQKICVADE